MVKVDKKMMTNSFSHVINVLVVSKSGRESNSLELILTSNYQVGAIFFAGDIKSAMEKASEIKPELILITQAFPVITIMECLSVIKNISPFSKCVVVSEKKDYQLLLQSQELFGVLYRGFQSNELYKLIDNIVLMVDKGTNKT
jgi:PleD family two-component response regulator